MEGDIGLQGFQEVKGYNGMQVIQVLKGDTGSSGPTWPSPDVPAYVTATYTSSYTTSQLSQLATGSILVFSNSIPFSSKICTNKYYIGVGLQYQAPSDWTLTFLNHDDEHVGSVDTRTSQAS